MGMCENEDLYQLKTKFMNQQNVNKPILINSEKRNL